jgi:hypothetical protein
LAVAEQVLGPVQLLNQVVDQALVGQALQELVQMAAQHNNLLKLIPAQQ